MNPLCPFFLSFRSFTRLAALALTALALSVAISAHAQTAARAVDIPTRPGVTQRILYIATPNPKATLILFTGGTGGLQIAEGGSLRRGNTNFIVRTRQLFADAGFAVAVIDAPSDKQAPPFLQGMRQTPEHLADVTAVIAWLRQQAHAPVWLVGTSRGTQSAAYIATERKPAEGGPDGIVLTSSILNDKNSRSVTQMPLERITVPVLVVHHEQDGCRVCSMRDMPPLMAKLGKAPKAELITFTGGIDEGDPCEPMAYHGFNGIEADVVARINRWLLARL